ncbi:MAG: stage V sporulation protein AD, partial [Defluviitaleaceae bacterium]|nr:stage V sporulation protein AD [Defluviitaleaceae bacterium]
TYVTTGKVVDYGTTDPMNMGAAMAPAAVDTIINHLKQTGTDANYYDMIATGDLGYIGHELVLRLASEQGYKLENYTDCGILIFDKEKQDTHSGGSGCACSAVTFAGYLYKQMLEKNLKTLLFVPTGALMSATSVKQKRPIMGIAHAISIEIV